MLSTLKATMNMPKALIEKKIREKAIVNAKERLMLEQLTPEELGLDQFEVIVHEEVEKIHAFIKDMSIGSLVTFLGLELLLG